MNFVVPLTDQHVAPFKPGFAEECRRLGKPVAASSGGAVILTEAQWADVQARFALDGGRASLTASRGGEGAVHPAAPQERRPTGNDGGASRGLGDAIHQVAGPIGRALGWPCLKGDGSTDLKPGSPCDKLRSALNNLTTQNTENTNEQ